VPRTLLSKDYLISALRTRYDHLLSLLTPLNEGQWLEPITSGRWSAKDIVAHLTAWDQRGNDWIAAAARGEVPAIPGPGVTWTGRHKLNAQTYWESQAMSTQTVVRNYQRSFRTLLRTAEAIDVEDWARLTPIQHKYGIGKPIPIGELVHWRLQHLVLHTRPIEQYFVRKP
jgi:hypothetical protein